MKVIVNDKETKDKESKYPYLGISDKKNIVLFTSPKTGMLMFGGNHICPKYDIRKDWAESMFTPFTGSITLSNDD